MSFETQTIQIFLYTLVWYGLFHAGKHFRTFFKNIFQTQNSDRNWSEMSHLFRSFIEKIQVGKILEPSDWRRLRNSPEPWGRYSSDCIEELRRMGAPITPTLQRFSELTEQHAEFLREGNTRAQQAYAQSAFGVALVPVVGAVLWQICPGVQEMGVRWWVLCGFATLLPALGWFWIQKMVDTSRWAKLLPKERPWLLESLFFGERLLAYLSGGMSGEEAWTEAMKILTPDLQSEWCHRELHPSEQKLTRKNLGEDPSAREEILQLGPYLHASLLVSQIQGTPVRPRLEESLRLFRTHWNHQVRRNLEKIPLQVLKPLFICLAPAVLGLLSFAVFQSLPAEIF